jgi:hypothetical protein
VTAAEDRWSQRTRGGHAKLAREHITGGRRCEIVWSRGAGPAAPLLPNGKAFDGLGGISSVRFTLNQHASGPPMTVFP